MAARRTASLGSSFRIPCTMAVSMLFTSASSRCSCSTSSHTYPSASSVAWRRPAGAWALLTLAWRLTTRSGHCLCGISAPAIFATTCAHVCAIPATGAPEGGPGRGLDPVARPGVDREPLLAHLRLARLVARVQGVLQDEAREPSRLGRLLLVRELTGQAREEAGEVALLRALQPRLGRLARVRVGALRRLQDRGDVRHGVEGERRNPDETVDLAIRRPSFFLARGKREAGRTAPGPGERVRGVRRERAPATAAVRRRGRGDGG